MTYPCYGDFEQEQWCRELLESDEFERVPLEDASRVSMLGEHANSFFDKTLSTPTTVRAVILLRRKKSTAAGECWALISLGSDLNGHSAFLAGSVACTFYDEIMAMAAKEALPPSTDPTGDNGSEHKIMFTGELALRYLKPVPSPGLILVKAYVARQKDRRIWTEGTIENGRGTVFSRGTATFVTPNPSKM